ncbi:MAG: DUF1569 domain-containing protein [Saprospiraceae bacterium]|nr:DUF1569 domain-containing protein [Saprospiraceae bacterium]
MAKKDSFLKEEAFNLLKTLEEDCSPKWGIMSAQHMVEHLGLLLAIAIEKIRPQPFASESAMQKFYQYLIVDDRPFTKNFSPKGMPEITMPLRYESLDLAIEKLQSMVDSFYRFFEEDPDEETLHPMLGELSFVDWEKFHIKHFKHHFAQFDLMETNVTI